MAIARAALLTLGAAACAWFALGIVASHDIDQATVIVSGSTPLRPPAARRAASLLDTAATLNPDSTVTLLRAQLATAGGAPRRALRILRGLVAQEPENLDAWVGLAQLALHGHRALLDAAVARIGRLDPRLE